MLALWGELRDGAVCKTARFSLILIFIPILGLLGLTGCGNPSKTEKQPSRETLNFAKDVRALSGDWQSNAMAETAEYINSCKKFNKTPSGQPCNPKNLECNRRMLAAFNSTPGTSNEKLRASNYAYIRCDYEFTEECTSLEISVYNRTKGNKAEKDKASNDAYSACVKQKTGL